MTDLFSEIQESLKGTQKTIVLPEGTRRTRTSSGSTLTKRRTCEADFTWERRRSEKCRFYSRLSI